MFDEHRMRLPKGLLVNFKYLCLKRCMDRLRQKLTIPEPKKILDVINFLKNPKAGRYRFISEVSALEANVENTNNSHSSRNHPMPVHMVDHDYGASSLGWVRIVFNPLIVESLLLSYTLLIRQTVSCGDRKGGCKKKLDIVISSWHFPVKNNVSSVFKNRLQKWSS